MFLLNKKAATLLLLLFTYLVFGQTTYSERIDIAHKGNSSEFFYFYNDTFYIPTTITETSPTGYSISLIQVKGDGTVIYKQRFKRNTESLYMGNGLLKKNNKIYAPGDASHSTDIRCSLYLFNNLSDTVFTKLTGDTSYYFYGIDIQENKLNKNEIISFGITDSTCGTGHPGHYRPIVRKIDTLGNVISTKLYMGAGVYRTLYNTDTTKDKGHIFSGFEQQSVWGWGSNYLVKLDSNLNVVWINYFDTTATITPAILTLKTGKHILAYGDLDSIVSNFFFWSRVAVLKINENGGIMWQKQYGNLTKHSTATNIKELPNGDLIVCGVTDQYTGSSSHPTQLYGFLMRIDSMGNQKWLRTYKAAYTTDTIGDSYLYDVLPMSDKGFAAVGFVASGDTSTTDTWLLRVDSMGCLMPGCNNVGIEYLQLKEDVAIKVYPNPFNNILSVSVSLGEHDEGAELLLIEPVTGRIISERKITFKKCTIEFQSTELSAGVYILSLRGTDFLPKNIKVVHVK